MTDEIRYTQETLLPPKGWMWIDRPSLTLAPEIVIGIWGSGHLTDSIENARAQSSLNGLEVLFRFKSMMRSEGSPEYFVRPSVFSFYQKWVESATLARWQGSSGTIPPILRYLPVLILLTFRLHIIIAQSSNVWSGCFPKPIKYQDVEQFTLYYL